MTKNNDEEPPTSHNSLQQNNVASAQAKSRHQHLQPMSLKRRYSLPDDFQFINTPDCQYELHGYLIKNVSQSDSNTSLNDDDESSVPIILTKLIHWEIDSSFQHRGIWVKTDSAWYYLKDPCHVSVPRVTYFDSEDKNATSDNHPSSSTKTTVAIDPTSSFQKHLAQDPYLPSQATLHIPLRAKIGLLSNILDIFSEKKGDKDSFYAPLHAKVSVEESYRMLSLDSNLLKTKYSHLSPPINDEPFDMKLLMQKGVAKFLRQQLTNYHLALSDNSVYMTSLQDLAVRMDEQKKFTLHRWSDNDFRQSAVNAENRGRRESWCGPLPNTHEIRPNRLIELEIEHDGIVDELINEKESEDQKKAVEGTAAVLLGGEKNPIFVMTESRSFDKNVMIECISNLSDYLSPTPLEDDKSNCDFTKFSVKDDKIDEFFGAQVLTDSIVSLESMLLIVTAISQSSDKVMKSMFKVRRVEDLETSPGKVIFVYWLCYVMNIMEKRRHRFSREKPTVGESRTEELITAAILELIAKYHVIKSSKQIDVLKNKFNVDWILLVQKVRKLPDGHLKYIIH